MSVVKVPYGRYEENEFSAPHRIDEITNSTDRNNAIVVFGVLMLHYFDLDKVKLMEVDKLETDAPTPYWRLCLYGLSESPTPEKIRQLAADMEPVTPLRIFFEPMRRSHAVVRGVFLTHALTVHMASTKSVRVPVVKRPTPLESMASSHVNDYPIIAQAREKQSARTTTLLRRRAAPTKRVSAEDKIDRVRQRFKQRNLFERAYDALVGVTLESVVEQIAARGDEVAETPSDDVYDQ